MITDPSETGSSRGTAVMTQTNLAGIIPNFCGALSLWLQPEMTTCSRAPTDSRSGHGVQEPLSISLFHGACHVFSDLAHEEYTYGFRLV